MGTTLYRWGGGAGGLRNILQYLPMENQYEDEVIDGDASDIDETDGESRARY